MTILRDGRLVQTVPGRRADRGVADGGDARPVARRDVPGQAPGRGRRAQRCSRSATWSRPASTASRSTCGRGRSSAWPAWSARAAPRSPGRSTGPTASTPGSVTVTTGDTASCPPGQRHRHPALRDAGGDSDDPRVAQGAGPAARPTGQGERQPVHARPGQPRRPGPARTGATDRAGDARPGWTPAAAASRSRRPRCPAATSRSCCSPGRCCATRPVLIADEPTRGVDVGAKRAIYELLTTLTADGARRAADLLRRRRNPRPGAPRARHARRPGRCRTHRRERDRGGDPRRRVRRHPKKRCVNDSAAGRPAGPGEAGTQPGEPGTRGQEAGPARRLQPRRGPSSSARPAQGGIIYPFIVLFVVLAIWKGSTLLPTGRTCSRSSTSSPRR